MTTQKTSGQKAAIDKEGLQRNFTRTPSLKQVYVDELETLLRAIQEYGHGTFSVSPFDDQANISNTLQQVTTGINKVLAAIQSTKSGEAKSFSKNSFYKAGLRDGQADSG